MGRTVEFGSIQVKMTFKKHIINYCNEHGLKISSFVENACNSYISGSLKDIIPARIK